MPLTSGPRALREGAGRESGADRRHQRRGGSRRRRSAAARAAARSTATVRAWLGCHVARSCHCRLRSADRAQMLRISEVPRGRASAQKKRCGTGSTRTRAEGTSISVGSAAVGPSLSLLRTPVDERLRALTARTVPTFQNQLLSLYFNMLLDDCETSRWPARSPHPGRQGEFLCNAARRLSSPQRSDVRSAGDGATWSGSNTRRRRTCRGRARAARSSRRPGLDRQAGLRPWCWRSAADTKRLQRRAIEVRPIDEARRRQRRGVMLGIAPAHHLARRTTAHG